ncbi:YhgE/Pip domain-containing protein [Bacillus infantis]|uniref:YhgE/Pip domain-containing protein n=1 Tax=Bacillus infantis TaxID=324767 RepID=A0A5D4SGF6_9BACI|nr:YhgE/Pip domain-containing protein [Bacillus infantis]MCP1157549.1 YhgE/Pip domain-containing protein [Bacillus infantis]TYS62687.1 YhgE/Pip domain-containing protein [Bacillus infantis]
MRNRLFRNEFSAIFKNRKLLIPIIAVLFIPVLYSGMFLWAFWDPYDHLADLPVAVVNEDKGAEFEGKELQLGDELISNLKDSADFNFKFVTKEEGYKDLEKEKYYILVEVPEDFSENATTLLDEDPKKLNLIYVPNESYNFLSSQIGGTAIEKIKASLSEKITETYAETMFDKIGDMTDGLVQASDGAGKLDEGALELKSGSQELKNKLGELAGKSVEFDNGVSQVNKGSAELAAGAKDLDSGLGKLQAGHQKLEAAASELQAGNQEAAAGAAKLNEGIQQVQGKVPALVQGGEQLQGGAASLSGSLDQWQSEAAKVSGGMSQLQQKLGAVLQQMPEDSPERKELEAALGQLAAGTSQLAESAGQISGGAQQLSDKIGSLSEGQKQLQQGIDSLAAGSSSLAQGTAKIQDGQQQFIAGMNEYGQQFASAKAGSAQLAAGSTELSGGLGKLADGSGALKEGAGKLSEGAGKVAEGNSALSEGSAELAGKLKDGAEEASSVSADDKTYNMIAEPVQVKNEKINEVPNYGTGFTPYFLSLGLFVGALLLSIVFPLREPASVPGNGLSWFAAKFGVLAAAGIIQALIASWILISGLGLEVQSIPLFLLFNIITSLTFMALIQFFVTALGDPGRFVAILILILQLTTSAGTFPLELIPGFLQHFNALLPMTYSVAGLKAVASSGDFAFMWHNAAILLGFMLAFIAGTITYFTIMHKRKYAAIAE